MKKVRIGRIWDEKEREQRNALWDRIARFIRDNPDITYQDTAEVFKVSRSTIENIARSRKCGRGWQGRPKNVEQD